MTDSKVLCRICGQEHYAGPCPPPPDRRRCEACGQRLLLKECQERRTRCTHCLRDRKK